LLDIKKLIQKPLICATFLSYHENDQLGLRKKSLLDRKKNLVVTLTTRNQRDDQAKTKLPGEGPSEIEILKTLSDNVSLNIISSVANGIEKPAELNSTTGFSKKQFYSRMALMIRGGLIKRDRGRVFLTSLGKISYYAKIKVENAIRIYWKLKAIDSIRDAKEMDLEERERIIRSIVGKDKSIEKILENQNRSNQS